MIQHCVTFVAGIGWSPKAVTGDVTPSEALHLCASAEQAQEYARIFNEALWPIEKLAIRKARERRTKAILHRFNAARGDERTPMALAIMLHGVVHGVSATENGAMQEALETARVAGLNLDEGATSHGATDAALRAWQAGDVRALYLADDVLCVPVCGDGLGSLGRARGHTCTNRATRISHVYERCSVYVCDIDHEGLEPWTEDTIQDLPTAQATRHASEASP